MNRFRKEKGAALLITVMIIAAMTYLITEMTYRSRIYLTLSSNFIYKTKSYYLARSGVEAAKLLLKYDREQDRENKKYIDYIANQEDIVNGESSDEIWSLFAKQQMPIPLRDFGTVSLQITDEQSKLNINGIDRGKMSEKGLKDPEINRYYSFFIKMGIPDDRAESMVYALIDWIDSNDDELMGGAESGYYQSLFPPYSARNNVLASTRELLMIKGFSYEDFNKIAPYITVFPKQRNKNYYINVNTASPEVLTFLDPGIDIDMANEIVAAREEEPFKSLTAFKKVLLDLGLEEKKVMDIITYSSKFNVRVSLNSNTFRVKSTGYVGDFKDTIETVIKRLPNGTFDDYYFKSY